MSGMNKEPSPRLKQAVTKLRNAEAAIAASREEVYDAILDDYDDGVRQVNIVQTTGLTRERIRQIVKAGQEKRGQAQ